MVDNCYGEFVETIEPSDVGADMTVGSLIKNPGGGLHPIGGYIAGTKECIDNAAFRMTCPGLGSEIGPSFSSTLHSTRDFSWLLSSRLQLLRGGFAANIYEGLGFKVLPDGKRSVTILSRP